MTAGWYDPTARIHSGIGNGEVMKIFSGNS
jgi:hypothetical protein